MLSKALRTSFSALLFQALLSAPASAAIINWQYAGTVSSNPTNYGGVTVGDVVSMTIAVDTSAPDIYGGGSHSSVEPCGFYIVPSVTVSFGGLIYESQSPTLTVNTPAGSGNCGYGPSRDGYVLVGGGSEATSSSLPWRIYAEIRDVPVSDSLPLTAPLGTGVFLELAAGFMGPSSAMFTMTASLTAPATSSSSSAVPEPLTLSLALVGLASFGAREVARRRASRLARRAPACGPVPTVHADE